MRINSKSTEPITVDGQSLDETDKFTGPGGVVANQGGGGEDIQKALEKIEYAALSNVNYTRAKLNLVK